MSNAATDLAADLRSEFHSRDARVHAAAADLLDALSAENERLRAAILDIDAHATPLGEDDDGFVSVGYAISVGCLHRALGLVGHAAAQCADVPCPQAAAALDLVAPILALDWPCPTCGGRRNVAFTDDGRCPARCDVDGQASPAERVKQLIALWEAGRTCRDALTAVEKWNLTP